MRNDAELDRLALDIYYAVKDENMDFARSFLREFKNKEIRERREKRRAARLIAEVERKSALGEIK